MTRAVVDRLEQQRDSARFANVRTALQQLEGVSLLRARIECRVPFARHDTQLPRPDPIGRLDRQPQVTQDGLPQIRATGGKRGAPEIGHAREAGQRQAAAGQLLAHLPLQRDWFRPQARVLQRSKALVGQKPNLFERIGSRVMAKQAQMRRIIASEARAVSPALPAPAASDSAPTEPICRNSRRSSIRPLSLRLRSAVRCRAFPAESAVTGI